MKKLILCAFALALLTGCTSDYQTGVLEWENYEYEKAQEWLSRVEPKDKNYDSAQILLKQLPDTACAYYLIQAEEKLDAEEFEIAIEACDQALWFKPDDADAIKLQKKIEATAFSYWIADARTQLDKGDPTLARESCNQALFYNPDSKTAKNLQKTIEAREAKKREKELLEARKKFAKECEYDYLDKGLNVSVTTPGRNATTLKLKWIGVSKVTAHEFGKKTELFQTLRELGFKKFVITDGYGETWYWDL